MATPKSILCRYYMSGACTEGSQCPFSHNSKKSNPEMTCRYYLQGSCSYGSRCRYDHVKPKQEKKTSSGAVSQSQVPAVAKVPKPVALPRAVDGYTEPQLVTLKKDPAKDPEQWVKALEFVPGGVTVRAEVIGDKLSVGGMSYTDVARTGLEVEQGEYLDFITQEEAASLLCPFAEMGECPFGEKCEYLHGDLCDMCGHQCLNPLDEEQQKAHHRQCLAMHEMAMEEAFQIKESQEKTCGICLDVVVGKLSKSERRFGILSHCDHCFCLECIRKWRSSTHANKTIRACPLCRVVSHFVVPSEVWIDDPEQKLKLISVYQFNLRTKPCKYFNMGTGACPFGTSCFYRHAYPDGTEAEVAAVRIYTDAEGAHKAVKETTLWDFINERDERSVLPPPQEHDDA